MRGAWLLVLAALLGPLRAAHRPDFEAERAALAPALVVALEELADVCLSRGAHAQRRDVYERLLEVAPDHDRARRFLGFQRSRDGAWTRSRAPRARPDRNAAATEAARAARERLLAPHRAAVLALLAAHPELDALTRDRELAALVRLLPDDAALRALRGEVRWERDGEPTWALEETARAEAVRAANRDLRGALRATCPTATPAPLHVWEERSGVGFLREAQAAGRVRAVGTTTTAELARIAEHAEWALRYLATQLGRDAHLDLSAYVLQSDLQRGTFLRRYCDAHEPPPSAERLARLLRLGGATLGADAFFERGDTAAQRLDGSLRMTIATYLRAAFGIRGDHGWLHEGLGLFLTHELVGTRLTTFVQPTRYVDREEPRADLDDLDEDWLAMARDVLERDEEFPLHFTLGRDVNQLTFDDLLVSYALCAYLLEGAPDCALIDVLQRVGQRGESPVTALEDALGLPLPVLRARLARWLVERTT